MSSTPAAACKPVQAAKRGPGRPKGSVNKTSINLIEKAAKAGGMLPQDFLLSLMRCQYILINGRRYVPTFEQRLLAAEKAAPYFAPRLSSVQVLEHLTDDELKALLIEALGDPAIQTLLSGLRLDAPAVENEASSLESESEKGNP